MPTRGGPRLLKKLIEMKPIIQKLLMIIAMLCVSITASASTFKVNGIYYSIISSDDMTCKVVRGEVEYSGHVTIPSVVTCEDGRFSVTEIGQDAFSYCYSLTSVTIPNSVKSIGDYAFWGCIGLISVTIPNSVTRIGNNSFLDCSSLTSVTIPGSVKSIGAGAFSKCSSLTSVRIPDSVKKIDAYAFSGCSSLTSVNIGSSVTEIGENAFYECSSLESVTIPDSVTEIGQAAFFECTSLTSVTIGSSVTKIGNGVFCLCRSLVSVTMSDSVMEIGNDVFYRCSSLTSVTLPQSLTSLGDYVFANCSRLTEISISSDNQNYSSIDGVLFNKDCTTILAFPNAKCEEYIIPASVTEIGNGAFQGCDALTSVTIPESVTIIGNYAFYDCVSLTSVTIPRGITGIGASAFSCCNNITSVYYNCEDPVEIDDNTIFYYSDDATLYVPASAVEKCRLISPWKEFKNIQAYDFSGVESVGEGEVKTVTGRFDMSGTTVDEKHKGMVIVRFSDGSVKKIIR